MVTVVLLDPHTLATIAVLETPAGTCRIQALSSRRRVSDANTKGGGSGAEEAGWGWDCDLIAIDVTGATHTWGRDARAPVLGGACDRLEGAAGHPIGGNEGGRDGSDERRAAVESAGTSMSAFGSIVDMQATALHHKP
jgi:hypothetical protein